jgi:hypothetical protein
MACVALTAASDSHLGVYCPGRQSVSVVAVRMWPHLGVCLLWHVHVSAVCLDNALHPIGLWAAVCAYLRLLWGRWGRALSPIDT